MTIARQIADLIDSGGDVVSGALDNVPDSDWNTLLNKPAHADTDTRNAANISSGTIPSARLGSGTQNSSTYLRGDGQWVTNCTNHANCATAGGTGTITTGSGSITGFSPMAASPTNPGFGGTACGQPHSFGLTNNSTTITMAYVACQTACACACDCACNC